MVKVVAIFRDLHSIKRQNAVCMERVTFQLWCPMNKPSGQLVRCDRMKSHTKSKSCCMCLSNPSSKYIISKVPCCPRCSPLSLNVRRAFLSTGTHESMMAFMAFTMCYCDQFLQCQNLGFAKLRTAVISRAFFLTSRRWLPSSGYENAAPNNSKP